jgi:hypothetical protein
MSQSCCIAYLAQIWYWNPLASNKSLAKDTVVAFLALASPGMLAVIKAFVIFNFKHRVFKIKKRGRGPGFF